MMMYVDRFIKNESAFNLLKESYLSKLVIGNIEN